MPITTSRRCVGAILFALSMLLPGCRFDANFDDTSYRCDESGQCPDGQTCEEGVCRIGLFQPPPNEVCGTTGAAIENFDQLDLDNLDWRRWTYWADGITSVYVDELGQYVITADPTEGDAGAGFGTRDIFPLEGATASIEIVSMDIDGTTDVTVEISARDSSTHASVYYEDGTLYMHYHPPDGSLDLATMPYDPVAHRFWRVRYHDDALRWETSADGIDFVEHASRTDASDFGAWVGTSVSIYKGAVGTVPVTVVVDNFNAAQEPVSFCPSDYLRDDFGAPTVGAQWYISDSGTCTISQEGGRLGVEFPDTDPAECVLNSIPVFDLSASTVTVEAPLEDVPDIEQCLTLTFPDGQDVEFELLLGELLGEKSLNDGNGTVFSVRFDPEVHRYWRFRGDGDTIFWELSSDGVEWQVMGSHQSPNLDLRYTRVALDAYSELGEIDNLGRGFDNLNLVP